MLIVFLGVCNDICFYFLHLPILIIMLLRILLLCLLISPCYAQKKVDRLIPEENQKKLAQAKKYFNQYKIYDGEKIIRELIKQNPNDYYYYEALVILQRQVLRKLESAREEMQVMEDSDSAGIFHELKSDSTKSDTALVIQIIQSHGLARNGNSNEEDTPKRRKKIEEVDPIQTEAIVTIDSSLLKDEEPNDFKDENESDSDSDEALSDSKVESNSKDSKALRKKMKFLREFASIPYDAYKNDLIRNSREATRMVEYADSASLYLREFMVDTISISTLNTDEALDKQSAAFEAYAENNYVAAVKLLEDLLQDFPHDYTCMLMLGDTYFRMGKDTQAILQFTKATKLNPNLPDAFQKVAEAYYNRGKFLEASSLMIEAIAIYPQHDYMNFLKRIIAKSGKGFETQWLQRSVYPVTTNKNYVEIAAVEKSPWVHYQQAENDVHSYFDTAGLVRPNEKTREKYLEVFAWKRMLDRSGKQYFPFARAMNQIGYLDCYVLISLFHQDLYGQFHDFTRRNPDKVKDYFYMLINWDNKKFDKLRKQVAYKKEDESKKDEPKKDKKMKKE
jgi:tetratricopeptide (TPR) repeat protein